MEIVIAILFSTVISMGVSLYFRMLSKKDDPLERINKFANKKTNELNEAFGKIQTGFNTLSSDFHAQQTQANAAVKLLKQQNDEFKAKLQTFDQSINAVKNIKTQIDAYSKILGELNDMTAQVEENLERLHKESGIISIECAIHSSKVNVVCPKCNKPARIGYEMEKDEKVRVCRRCGNKLK